MAIRGTVGKVRKNAKGDWYTLIKGETASDGTAYYKLRPGDESTFIEGAKVEYEQRAAHDDPSKLFANNVRPLGAGIPPARPRVQTQSANPRQAETDAEYYLPRDTAELLFHSAGVTVDNTALKTQKYIRVYREPEKKLKILSGEAFSAAEKNLLSVITRDQLDVVSAYEYARCVTGSLGARMAMGLGGGSVFETAITLHHTYGIPYIPGSAVKGSLRSFVIRYLFDGSEIDALADTNFIDVFGTQKQRGGVIFLDVFPVRDEKLALELDIMNPHYADYYQGNTPKPTDDMSPKPIKFYAVPGGTRFMFRLVSNKTDIRHAEIKGTLLTEMIETVLSEMGIGAKTAVGYGWFGNLRGETLI